MVLSEEPDLGIPEQDRERQILERILSLKQFIQVDGGEGRDYHELGICYYYLRNYDQAADYLDQIRLVEADYPRLPMALGLQVLCLIETGDYPKALTTISLALREFGDNEQLLGMQAWCLDQSGQTAQAIEIHRRILQSNPENLNSLNSLGYMLALRGADSDLQEAGLLLKRALQLKPGYPAYLDSFGLLLLKQGDSVKARVAIQKALQQLPEHSEILAHLAQVLEADRTKQT
ncbi:MAG: tetratricopeptide repeat protein [Leptospiraceae bacterium]|nr:tetratricopeptide repeat protein [Leptospiraceae bacterium]